MNVAWLVGAAVASGCGRIGFDSSGGADPFGPGVVTIAGGPEEGFADGIGEAAQFYNPVNIDIGPSGLLYVNDWGNHRVRSVTPDGAVSTVLAQSNVVKPYGLAGTASELYVSTDSDGVVWRVTVADRTAVQLATVGGGPRGLTVAPDGRLVVSNRTSHTVSILDPETGSVTPLAGQQGVMSYRDGPGSQAQFSEPHDVEALSDGSFIVADSTNHRLRRIATDGTVTTYAGNGIDRTLDGIGTAAQLDYPRSLAVDGHDVLYVGEVGGHVIRRVSPDQRVVTIAGTGVAGFHDDADPLQAEFYGIEGMTVSSDDRYLYIADGDAADGSPHHRIRRLDLASIVP